MIQKIFAVYDKAAEAFLTPFFLHKDAMAQRSFEIQTRDPSSMISKAPQDYALFRLGEYDDETAAIVLEPHGPKPMGTGLDYMKGNKPEGASDEA